MPPPNRKAQRLKQARPPNIKIELSEEPILSNAEHDSKKPIKEESRPDVNQLEWDNKNYSHLEIIRCSFNVELGISDSRIEDEFSADGNLLLPPTRADIVSIHRTIEKMSLPLERLTKSVRWLGWIVVIAGAIAASRWFR